MQRKRYSKEFKPQAAIASIKGSREASTPEDSKYPTAERVLPSGALATLCPDIVPNGVTGPHLVKLDKPWRSVQAEPSVGGIRFHDLQRAVGSRRSKRASPLILAARF
jgi:hypothetical protein